MRKGRWKEEAGRERESEREGQDFSGRPRRASRVDNSNHFRFSVHLGSRWGRRTGKARPAGKKGQKGELEGNEREGIFQAPPASVPSSKCMEKCIGRENGESGCVC